MSTTPVAPAPPSRDPLYRGYRFPAEIISHAVWLCYRFALSHRDSEELLAERGVQVSYEAIRLWCQRFGPLFGGTLRRRRSRSADKWHLDEMQLKIKGKKHWLWRAADRDGLVLDILVQERRTQEAAERFLGAPRARGGGARGAGGGDRQTGQLPSPQRSSASCRTPSTVVTKASTTALVSAPAGAETSARATAVHVTGARAAGPGALQRCLQPLPPPPPPPPR